MKTKIILLSFLSCLFISCNKKLYVKQDDNNCDIYILAINYLVKPKKETQISKIISPLNIYIYDYNYIKFNDSIPYKLVCAWFCQESDKEWMQKLNSRDIYLERFSNDTTINTFACKDYLLNNSYKLKKEIFYWKYPDSENDSEYINFRRNDKNARIIFNNIMFDQKGHAFLYAEWYVSNGEKVFFFFVFTKDKKHNKWELDSFRSMIR
jgi:hypothetical protein